ncbi:putative glutathione S-transferase [Silene latifolia]|uniref:putative glutathione S-transferase n=1 Tax=Silene latifolia TaxID=37657 RepID=UPI003D7755A3
MGEVKVYRMWSCPCSWRVELALKIKGIDYEIIDEDLKNKSDQLIKYNPVHKKIPVLVHDGKPVVESLVILEYIDEIWKGNALLPSDSYERAQARLWANFIDEKIFPATRKVGFSRGDDVEKAKEELDEVLEIFEKGIEGKKLFEGNKIGYLDIVALLVCFWIPVMQEALEREVLTREKFPRIYAWSDGLLGQPIIKENLPKREDFLAFYRVHFGRSS